MRKIGDAERAEIVRAQSAERIAAQQAHYSLLDTIASMDFDSKLLLIAVGGTLVGGLEALGKAAGGGGGGGGGSSTATPIGDLTRMDITGAGGAGGLGRLLTLPRSSTTPTVAPAGGTFLSAMQTALASQDPAKSNPWTLAHAALGAVYTASDICYALLFIRALMGSSSSCGGTGGLSTVLGSASKLLGAL